MASPTLHLMWKEYRTLRALWLAALVLVTLFFVAIALVWPDPSAEGIIIDGLIVTAAAANVFISLLFASIAICMMFTLETEDRTSLLMFQFAPTWRQLMAGKLTTVFVLAVALLLTAFLADGLVVGLMSLTNATPIRTWSPTFFKYWDSTKAWNAAIVFAAVVLFIVQTALCFAFLFRKVIGAVLATLFFLLLVCYPLGIYAAEEIGMAGLSVFVITTSTLTGILSVAWHRGLLPYKMTTWAAGETADSHTEGVAQSWSQSARHRIAMTPFLHGWISAVSRQQESRWRMASALLWKEVRSGWAFLLVCGLLGCFVIAMSQPSRHGFRLFLLCALGWLYCLECGLRTFRSDRSDGSLMFAGQRGTSPFLVWCVKVGFWLTVTLAGLNLVKLLDGRFPMIAHDPDGSSPRGLPVGAIPWLLNLIQTSHGWHADAGPNFFRLSSIPLTFTLSCFVAGLVATCWIRRSVLSFGFALALSIALLTSLGRCMTNDLPEHRLLWPLLLVWVVATLAMARSTVELRRSWKLDVARIGLLLIPAALAWWAAGSIRFYQVPRVVSIGNPIIFGIPATESPLIPWMNDRNVSTSVKPVDADAEKAWKWLSHPPAINEHIIVKHTDVSVHRFAIPLTHDSASESRLRNLMAGFDQLRALSDRDIINGINQSSLTQLSRNAWPSPAVAEAAIYRSRENTAAGQHLEAGRCLIDGVRLIRVLNQVSTNWNQWTTDNIAERTVLKEFSQWAADDAVSLDDLHATATQLRTLTQNELSPVAMLNNRYYVMFMMWVDPSMVDREVFDFHQFTQWKQLSSNERGRLVKALDMIRAITLNEFEAGTYTTWGVEKNDTLPTDTRQFLQRILGSTMDCGLDLADDPVVRADVKRFEESAEFLTLLSTTTAERATRLILELQAYRRRFGEFPGSLEMLMSEDWHGQDEPLPVDAFVPGTGERFGYSATGAGIPVAIRNDTGIRIIAPNQPLLWSRSHPASIDYETRKNRAPALFLWLKQASEEATQTTSHDANPPRRGSNIYWSPADTKTINLEW